MLSITHLHTAHSWDSQIRPERLMDALAARGVDLALVSDHDSFAGATECQTIAARKNMPITIPLAAEIRTDRGDVIVVLDPDMEAPAIVELKRWMDLVPAVRNRGGVIWLPHPYQGHDYVEEIAAEADVIEVFNARCSPEQNRNAALLCARHGAVGCYGADVHRLNEIDNLLVDYDDAGSVVDTLRTSPRLIHHQPTSKSNIMAAEVTNGLTKRRPGLVAWAGVQWLVHRKREMARDS